MGQEKLSLEGFGMEWGGGICSFLIMKVENFWYIWTVYPARSYLKKHQKLYNVLEEKKNNQSLFLGKVCKV